MLSTHVDCGAASPSKKKTCPSRGKRYSKSQKEEILEYVKDNTVDAAAGRFNVTGNSISQVKKSQERT